MSRFDNEVTFTGPPRPLTLNFFQVAVVGNGGPLLNAVVTQDFNKVSELLSHQSTNNIDVNELCDNGQTALHLACAMGDIRTVRALVEHKCDVLKQSRRGLTAVQQCIGHSPATDEHKQCMYLVLHAMKACRMRAHKTQNRSQTSSTDIDCGCNCDSDCESESDVDLDVLKDLALLASRRSMKDSEKKHTVGWLEMLFDAGIRRMITDDLKCKKAIMPGSQPHAEHCHGKAVAFGALLLKHTVQRGNTEATSLIVNTLGDLNVLSESQQREVVAALLGRQSAPMLKLLLAHGAGSIIPLEILARSAIRRTDYAMMQVILEVGGVHADNCNYFHELLCLAVGRTNIALVALLLLYTPRGHAVLRRRHVHNAFQRAVRAVFDMQTSNRRVRSHAMAVTRLLIAWGCLFAPANQRELKDGGVTPAYAIMQDLYSQSFNIEQNKLFEDTSLNALILVIPKLYNSQREPNPDCMSTLYPQICYPAKWLLPMRLPLLLAVYKGRSVHSETNNQLDSSALVRASINPLFDIHVMKIIFAFAEMSHPRVGSAVNVRWPKSRRFGDTFKLGVRFPPATTPITFA
jgi:Ankyrin repeats (3 copies)